MAITNARIQVRRGLEKDFDPDKMSPGEWAVSTDTKYVRICFSPGVCVRMATYEAFEADMEQIRGILAECQTVEEAVQRIYEDIKDVAVDVERIEAAAASALESKENALNSANSATQSANTATQKASEAVESANIASTKAEQATEGANTSTQKASEALNSAENAKLSEDKSVENAKLSESYAVGGTGTRTGEDTDNSKYYSEVAKTESDKATTEADRAKTEADRAASIGNIDVAKEGRPGIVQPDGTTTTVDDDGTIHAVGGGGASSYEELPDKPSINGYTLEGNKTNAQLGIPTKASDVKAIPISQKGVANGVAELDANGLVPSSQLPSYVDDVLEYDTKTGFPANGESGKIYIATDTNLQYRWTGTQYIEISSSIALGETSSTAYRGDRGKIAYDHSQKTSGNPHKVTKSDVGLSNVPNVTTNNQAPTFTKASTRANIASGEKLSVLFGKIMKWFADLKAVAFSGSYNDLSNKPTIPTVNNATLTIQKNGSNVQTFTANSSSNKTANIIVPTKTSELTNDSGFMSSATSLDTYEEIMANTASGKFAGAKGVKEGFSEINDSLKWSQPIYNGSGAKAINFDASKYNEFHIYFLYGSTAFSMIIPKDCADTSSFGNVNPDFGLNRGSNSYARFLFGITGNSGYFKPIQMVVNGSNVLSSSWLQIRGK